MVDFKSELENVINANNISEENLKKAGIYKSSINKLNNTIFFLVSDNTSKKLVLSGDKEYFDLFEGVEESANQILIKVCELNHKNAVSLRKIFDFTAPKALKDCDITIGLGDRLGRATPGHLKLLEKYDFHPVVAQQSIRELNLTKRTYKDVLDDVTWAVFREGYKNGYGADGDHLKTFDEIEMAIDNGFTMLTLDCSDHIDNSVLDKSEKEIDDLYNLVDKGKRLSYEKYIGKQNLNGLEFNVEVKELKKIVLIYGKAIDFTESVYNKFIKENDNIVFELSIDETIMTTSLEAHFITAGELISRGVKVDNLAPRFCGEFQKGIDYIGNVDEFREEFRGHCSIANHFGYKISVHSGSDKFSIFPIVGEETKGRYHLKTAGTNWLEAVRVIAKVDYNLYREMHKFAEENIDEARKYYHIGAKQENIENIDKKTDNELEEYMNKDDSRQFLHVTYGLILNELDKNGNYKFKDRIFNLLDNYEKDYEDGLIKHLGRHLEMLKVPEK